MTADPGTPLDSVRATLRGYPPALLQEFEAASVHVERRLAGDALRTWAEQGLDVARESLRSWEAAADYYRASPAVLDEIGFPRFTEWGRIGADLAAESPALGGAYFRGSPRALEHLSIAQAGDWSAQGRGLYKGTWKSSSLAAQYFEVSPDLLPLLPLGQLRLLVELVDALSGHSYELASSCLAMAPRMLADLVRADRAPFLEFGIVVAGTAWADARVYFERGPGLLERLAAPQRARYLTLASRVALRVGRHGHPYFLEAAQALAAVQPEAHQDLIDLAEELVEDSAPGAMEFLKSSPAVLERLYPEDLPRWQAAGRAILHASEDGGVAFFRLESAKAEEVIDTLTSRLELTRIGELLRLYCKALTGADVAVHPAETLTEKGVGWVSESSPTTEGSAIYLPARVEQYDTKAENFAVYKVYATHQAARLEFGSFRFEFDRPSALFQDQRAARAGRPAGKALTDMERFFDLFEDRRLAHDLFTILEDTRIDAAVKREYAGIRRAFNRLQQDAADRRPDVEQMPARQAMVENLLRASLDEAAALRWPPALARLIAEPLRILQRVRVEGASVEDAAEGVIRLYDWLARIPNVELEELAWNDADAPDDADLEGDTIPLPAGSAGPEESFAPSLPAGEPQPYESPAPVEFRGEFKPELVQLLMRMRSQDQPSDDAPLAPLSPEQLQQLLEKSVEITLTDLTEGDLSETSGLFMENLMKELAEVAQQGAQGSQDADDGPSSGEEDAAALGEMEASYYYDEWDFRANDYKPRWCRVREQRLATGDSDFYDRTLADYAVLVRQTRQQFEMLRPELFRKIKHLPDGDDYDLDAVVDWYVSRAARAPSDCKVYYRRNKVERDVAVAFLLDMSASTDEEIHKQPRRYDDDDQFVDDPRKYLTWWAQRRAQEAQHPAKRIIDLEKEAIVLLIEALEAIGDRYGVYGFSGYGRDNVEFYIVKDLEEPFGDPVKQRIDKISPIRSTRMGPAIRHCIYKLGQVQAKVRILVLLSDGRPQGPRLRPGPDREGIRHPRHQAGTDRSP